MKRIQSIWEIMSAEAFPRMRARIRLPGGAIGYRPVDPPKASVPPYPHPRRLLREDLLTMKYDKLPNGSLVPRLGKSDAKTPH